MFKPSACLLPECTKRPCQSGVPKYLETKGRCCWPFIILAVIFFFVLFQSRSISLSLPLSSFNLHMRCYLGPLYQVTSHSCLCPPEDGVLSTVRTHCSTSEEEEMKRLEVALATIPRPLNRQRDKVGKCRWRKTSVNEKMWRQSLLGQLPLSMISGSLKMDAAANVTLTSRSFTPAVLSGRSPDNTLIDLSCVVLEALVFQHRFVVPQVDH